MKFPMAPAKNSTATALSQKKCLVAGSFEKKIQNKQRHHDGNGNQNHQLILHHSECRTAVLQIAQLKHAVYEYVGWLILQMGYRKHFGKLIEQNEEHCSHTAGQIAFQNR